MSLGSTPYPTVLKLHDLLKCLREDYRMEKPQYCSMNMYVFYKLHFKDQTNPIFYSHHHRYSLMRECWHFDPDKRPAFSDIVQILDHILSLTSDKEYLDFGLPALDTPPSSECDSDTDTEDDDDISMNAHNQLTNSAFISRNMY